MFLGGSNYSGELSNGFIVLSETQPSAGAFIRYNATRRFSLKGNIYYGRIQGSDENASEPRFRQRNLHFRSMIIDFALQGEYNFLPYAPGTQYDFTPYISTGVAAVRFNPMAQFSGRADGKNFNEDWVQLQPLSTEGQGTTEYNDLEKYSLTEFAIPATFGLKYAVDDHISVGLEIGTRFTFTDYLDDVSGTYPEFQILLRERGELAALLSNRSWEREDLQTVGQVVDYTLPSGQEITIIDYGPQHFRGNPDSFDWYHFLGLTVSYTFQKDICFRF